MADFCRDCSIHFFGEDFRELAGITTPEETAQGLYANVICEGCGFTQVDHEGVVPNYDPTDRDFPSRTSKCIDLNADVL